MPKRKSISLAGPRLERVKAGHEDATVQRLTMAQERGFARADAQGVRRIGDPFDALHARNLLDRDSPESNAMLWQAGERLRRHWHAGRLDALAAFDFTRDSVDGTGGAMATPPSEAALRHRQAFRGAIDAIGSRLAPYVIGVVIDARTVAELRSLVTDTGHARTADALVIERLREALHRLCELWRMKGNVRPRSIRTWRDDGGSGTRPDDEH